MTDESQIFVNYYTQQAPPASGRFIVLGILGIVVSLLRFAFHAILLFGAIAVFMFDNDARLPDFFSGAGGIILDILLLVASIASICKSSWSPGLAVVVSKVDLLLSSFIFLGWLVQWMYLAGDNMDQYAEHLGGFTIGILICAVQSLIWWIAYRGLRKRSLLVKPLDG